MGFAERYIELRDFAAKNAQTVETDREKFIAFVRAFLPSHMVLTIAWSLWVA
jgi:hypothetical protein